MSEFDEPDYDRDVTLEEEADRELDGRHALGAPRAAPTMADCDCMIPYLEGAGQHAPGCSIFRADAARRLPDVPESEERACTD